jgi:hypothetical protein
MGQAARAQQQLELQHLDEPLVAVALRRIKACGTRKLKREAAMRQFMTTMIALTAFGAMVAAAQAENQSVRPSQAASAAYAICTGLKAGCLSHKGRGSGPQQAEVSLALFSQAYREQFCNFYWEQCMKTGWWPGHPAERR